MSLGELPFTAVLWRMLPFTPACYRCLSSCPARLLSVLLFAVALFILHTYHDTPFCVIAASECACVRAHV